MPMLQDAQKPASVVLPSNASSTSPTRRTGVLAAWDGRVKNATPPVRSSAAACWTDFLSLLQDYSSVMAQ
ncbi:MAG: hypothetical protein ABI988_13945, partial [Nitrospirota bacterium]